ncbi:venom serine protease isoform X1 [Musca domestica]|uniref:Venom serine protease isoform X1 n=1 Tax=Musca domestica TaxID=7370 RepID=A0A9J7CML1_MUSDO|nr:venom serine protease isoform X1 [Musca domestica]
MWSSGLRQMRSSLNVFFLLTNVFCLLFGSASALFEGCDHTFQINPGTTYLESPYYPSHYPAGTSCRYKFVAPLDYDITVNCSINLNMGSNACSTEYFYVAVDGDEYLRGSEQFCGKGVIQRKSLFRSVVFAYTSGGSWGSFRCQLYAAPQPCDCGWSVNTKIVNGQETGINEYPGVVALKTSEAAPPFCSATIISHYYLLTAAHCTELVPNPASYIIKAGDHNLAISTETKYAVNYYVAQIIQHPGYTSRPTMINDISLLRTTTAIEWSRGVGPMCLPPPMENDFTYTYVDLVGWGTTSFAGAYSDTLQKTTVIITDNESCAKTYNDTTIYPTQICTYDYTGTSRDSCQYDSGGPVIRRTLRQYILGCISFGKFCGQGGYATGVNTRISSYLTWIYQSTGYSTCVVS